MLLSVVSLVYNGARRANAPPKKPGVKNGKKYGRRCISVSQLMLSDIAGPKTVPLVIIIIFLILSVLFWSFCFMCYL